MRENKFFYFSTSFAALFMAVFMIGSINQSIVTQEKTGDDELTVVSTNPSDGEMDVARNVVIEITFSEKLDSTAMRNSTFTLMHGAETVTGALQFSGDKGTFTTTENLMAETIYTANIMVVDNQSDDDRSDEEFNDEQPVEEYSAGNGMEWSFTTGGNSGPVETVDLGSAVEYVILARSSIDDDSTSEITGEKGFDANFKSSKDNKKAYWLNNEDVDKKAVRKDTTREKSDDRNNSANEADLNSENLAEALEDMMTAYTDAEERTPVDFIDYKFVQSDDKADSTWDDSSADDYDMNSNDSKDADMEEDYNAESEMDENRNESSITLESGVYKWNESVEISSNITLSGDAEDVWIFQVPEGLTVNRDVEITLSDGAVAEHVFWQVAGEVTIGSSAHIEGIILSQKGITMENGATLNGRMLAQTDVMLDDNTIIEPRLLNTAERIGSNK